mgnify:CR=1 FL=1
MYINIVKYDNWYFYISIVKYNNWYSDFLFWQKYMLVLENVAKTEKHNDET